MNEITTEVGTNGWVSATGPIGKELELVYTLVGLYGTAVMSPDSVCERHENGNQVTVFWLNSQAVTAL